jgi:hypothetical protein
MDAGLAAACQAPASTVKPKDLYYLQLGKATHYN